MKNLLLPLILLVSLVAFANPATHTGITTDTTVSDLVVRLDSLEEQVQSLQNENEALKFELSEVQDDVSESRSLDASVVESLNNISTKLDNQNEKWMLINNLVLALVALISLILNYIFQSRNLSVMKNLNDVNIDVQIGWVTQTHEIMDTSITRKIPHKINIINRGKAEAYFKYFDFKCNNETQSIDIINLNPGEMKTFNFSEKMSVMMINFLTQAVKDQLDFEECLKMAKVECFLSYSSSISADTTYLYTLELSNERHMLYVLKQKTLIKNKYSLINS